MDDIIKYMQKKGCKDVDALSPYALSFIESIVKLKGRRKGGG